MPRKINVEYLNKRFEESTNSFTKKAMFKHIIKARLDVGDIPKELTTTSLWSISNPTFNTLCVV